jgi:hypothetical protein
VNHWYTAEKVAQAHHADLAREASRVGLAKAAREARPARPSVAGWIAATVIGGLRARRGARPVEGHPDAVVGVASGPNVNVTEPYSAVDCTAGVIRGLPSASMLRDEKRA